MINCWFDNAILFHKITYRLGYNQQHTCQGFLWECVWKLETRQNITSLKTRQWWQAFAFLGIAHREKTPCTALEGIRIELFAANFGVSLWCLKTIPEECSKVSGSLVVWEKQEHFYMSHIEVIGRGSLTWQVESGSYWWLNQSPHPEKVAGSQISGHALSENS